MYAHKIHNGTYIPEAADKKQKPWIEKPGIAGSKKGLPNCNFPKGFKFHEYLFSHSRFV
jgi:hypothetical protein